MVYSIFKLVRIHLLWTHLISWKSNQAQPNHNYKYQAHHGCTFEKPTRKLEKKGRFFNQACFIFYVEFSKSVSDYGAKNSEKEKPQHKKYSKPDFKFQFITYYVFANSG